MFSRRQNLFQRHDGKDASEPHITGMPLRQVVATRPFCQIQENTACKQVSSNEGHGNDKMESFPERFVCDFGAQALAIETN